MPRNNTCHNPFLGWILLLVLLILVAPFVLIILGGNSSLSLFSFGQGTSWLAIAIIITLFIVLLLLALLWLTFVQRIKKLFEPIFRPLIVSLRTAATAIDISANATDVIRTELSNIGTNLHNTATALSNLRIDLPVVPGTKTFSQALNDATGGTFPAIGGDPIRVMDGTFSARTIYPLQPVSNQVDTVATLFTNASNEARTIENRQQTLATTLRSIANLLEAFIS